MTDTDNIDTTAARTSAIRCSFCLRSSDEAGKMVKGPEGAICDRCISECTPLIDGRAPTREGGYEVAQIRLQAFAALKGWGSTGPDGTWKAWGKRELMEQAEELAEWALARSLSKTEDGR